MRAFPHRRHLVPCLALLVVPLATGCVRVEEYDQAIYALQNARAEAARNGAAAAAANAEVGAPERRDREARAGAEGPRRAPRRTRQQYQNQTGHPSASRS